MEHTFLPIDSELEKEQWFRCACGAQLPESELKALSMHTDLLGPCETHERQSDAHEAALDPR